MYALNTCTIGRAICKPSTVLSELFECHCSSLNIGHLSEDTVPHCIRCFFSPCSDSKIRKTMFRQTQDLLIIHIPII